MIFNTCVFLNDSSVAGRTSMQSLALRLKELDDFCEIIYIGSGTDDFKCDRRLKIFSISGKLNFLSILFNRMIVMFYLILVRLTRWHASCHLIVLTDRSIKTEPFALAFSKLLSFKTYVIPFSMTSKYVRLYRRLNSKYFRRNNSIRSLIFKMFGVVPLKADDGNYYDFYTLSQWIFGGGTLFLPKYPWSIGCNKYVDHSFHQSIYEIDELNNKYSEGLNRHWSGTPSHDILKAEKLSNSRKMGMIIALPQLYSNGITSYDECKIIWNKLIQYFSREYLNTELLFSLHPKDKNEENIKFLNERGFPHIDLELGIKLSKYGVSFFIGSAISMYSKGVAVIAVNDFDPHFDFIQEDGFQVFKLETLLESNLELITRELDLDDFSEILINTKLGRFDSKCSDRIAKVILNYSK